MLDSELQAIADELASISLRLTDLAIERLRIAREESQSDVEAAIGDERRINRARNAVERAKTLLARDADAEPLGGQGREELAP